jgi:hypothetical protein
MKWLQLLKKETEINYNLINLEQAKTKNEKSGQFSIPEFPMPELEAIFPEKELKNDQELKNFIPEFNPEQGAETAYLWYLIEDEKILDYFLQMGIKTWGQLKTLLETTNKNIIAPEKIDEIKSMGRCLEMFVDSWKIGRGQPVNRSVLKKTDAVTQNFIDKVAQLAENEAGDAEIIISKLRQGQVSNFLKKKIDQLEQYFKENGYIASEEILTADEIYARIIGVISGDKSEDIGKKVRRLWDRLL